MNVHIIERIIRFAIGLGLIAFAAGYIYPNTGWNYAGWLGMIPLLTSVMGWCPLYSLLGVSTCARKPA